MLDCRTYASRILLFEVRVVRRGSYLLENEDASKDGGDWRENRGRNPANQLGNRKWHAQGRCWEEE